MKLVMKCYGKVRQNKFKTENLALELHFELRFSILEIYIT